MAQESGIAPATQEKFHALSNRLDAANTGERDMSGVSTRGLHSPLQQVSFNILGVR